MGCRWWTRLAVLTALVLWVVPAAAGQDQLVLESWVNGRPADFAYQVRESTAGPVVACGRVPAGQEVKLWLNAGWYQVVVTSLLIADRPVRRFRLNLAGAGAVVKRRVRFTAGRLRLLPGPGRRLPAGRLRVRALTKVPRESGPNVAGVGLEDPRRDPAAAPRPRYRAAVVPVAAGGRPELWLEPGLYRVLWSVSQAPRSPAGLRNLVIIDARRTHELVVDSLP